MSRRWTAVVAGVALAFSACVNTQVIDWTGLTISGTVSELGAPNRAIPVKDGTVCFWYERKGTRCAKHGGPDGGVPGSGPGLHLGWVLISDAGGRITLWSVQEARSPASFEAPVSCGR